MRTRSAKPAYARAVRHLERQLGEIDQAGPLWQDYGLIFATERGTPLSRDNLGSRSFKPLLKRAGLPQSTRFHDLRHTCATILLSKGVHAKFVQELLGHSTIAIILDTYSHVLPGMGAGTADAMETSFSNCTSYVYEIVTADVVGDMAFTAGYERTQVQGPCTRNIGQVVYLWQSSGSLSEWP